MVQAQRDAAWGEVARRLAHEIKNPLTPIQLSAERLQYKLANKLEHDDANMLKRATETIVNQVSAMKTMVNEFSEYARAPSAHLTKININQLIKDVSMLYENARDELGNASTTQAKLSFDLSNNMPDIMGDATMLRQVLHNLMQNAQDALNLVENPEINVQTSFDETNVKLTVKDNGQGFPAELISHAFEPYVTTKAHGTGLGLAIVKKMVEEHFGQIKVENNATGGASITILIPIPILIPATISTAPTGMLVTEKNDSRNTMQISAQTETLTNEQSKSSKKMARKT